MVKSLKSEQIKAYMQSLVQAKKQQYDPTRLREALVVVKFTVYIPEPTARITTYCVDTFESFCAIGYEDFEFGESQTYDKISAWAFLFLCAKQRQ